MLPRIHLWGDVAISTYFAAIALGITLGTFVLRREALREGMRVRDVFDVALVVVPAGALGARAFMWFEEPGFYLDNPWHLLSPRGGFAVQGALLGAVGGLMAMSRIKGLQAWRVLDLFAPAFMFGQVFARLGCLGSGCCHGRPADWPFGVPVPWAVRYHTFGHAPEELLAVPLHPSPLYESFLALGMFVALTGLRRRQAYPGQTFLALLLGYGVGRFVLEWFRGDLSRGFHFGEFLSTGQVTSLVLIAAAIGLHLQRRRTCIPSS